MTNLACPTADLCTTQNQINEPEKDSEETCLEPWVQVVMLCQFLTVCFCTMGALCLSFQVWRKEMKILTSLSFECRMEWSRWQAFESRKFCVIGS